MSLHLQCSKVRALAQNATLTAFLSWNSLKNPLPPEWDNAGLFNFLVSAMLGSSVLLYPQCYGVQCKVMQSTCQGNARFWVRFVPTLRGQMTEIWESEGWKIILEYQVQLMQNTAGSQPRLIKLAKYGQISCCLAFRYKVHEIWAPNLKFLQLLWWVCICKAQKSQPLLKMRLWLPFCPEIP